MSKLIPHYLFRKVYPFFRKNFSQSQRCTFSELFNFQIRKFLIHLDSHEGKKMSGLWLWHVKIKDVKCLEHRLFSITPEEEHLSCVDDIEKHYNACIKCGTHAWERNMPFLEDFINFHNPLPDLEFLHSKFLKAYYTIVKSYVLAPQHISIYTFFTKNKWNEAWLELLYIYKNICISVYLPIYLSSIYQEKQWCNCLYSLLTCQIQRSDGSL